MFKWSSSDLIVLPGAFLCIVFFALLSKKFLKNKQVPLKLISVLVIILEITKQILSIILNTYTTFTLPLHFCSTFFILYPLAQFGNNKIKNFFKPVAFTFSFIVTFMLFVSPKSLIGTISSNVFENFFSFHGFTHHILIVAYFIFSLVLHDYKPKRKDWLNCCFCISIYTSIIIPCSYIFKTNYVNILHSQIDIVEKYRIFIGQPLFLISYYILMNLIVFLICFFNLKIHKKTINPI